MTLDEIHRVRIQGRIEILRVDLQPLVDVIPPLPLCPVGKWKLTTRRIDLGTRTEAANGSPPRLVPVEARGIGIGATDSKRVEVIRILTPASTGIKRQCPESMLDPTDANLLDAFIGHPIHVLCNDRMLVGVILPGQGCVPDIADIGCD